MNEGCFILFTRDWEKNNQKHFHIVEIRNVILIYINIKRVFQMKFDESRCYWNPKILEYKWTRLLNKCMHAVTRYFSTSISNELYIFFKKNDEHGFLSYTKYLLTKN